MLKKSKPIALLIDGDNISPESISRLLNEVSKHGNPIIREVFFNKNSLEQWEVQVNKFSLTPTYVPNNTRGKNAADIALVIRAMELFYERKDLAGFCIVSSDSDFTGLAKHIVAGGKPLLGIGENKAPESFRNACSQFLDIENLPEAETLIEKPNGIFNQDDDDVSVLTQTFEQLFIQAYEDSSNDSEGWVQLREIKERMTNLDPDYQNTRQFAEKVKSVAGTYPVGIIQVDEMLDHKPVLHLIRIADCDIFKFIEAYQHTPVKERDGWVFLSMIGAELRKYPSYENGFIYRCNRYKRLSKAVAEMSKDYDGLIEIREEGDGKSVIYLVRVNL